MFGNRCLSDLGSHGKNVGQWVKAVFDSTLRQLGTIGVLTVEVFFQKMKSAFAAVLSKSSQTLSEPAIRRSSDAGPSGQLAGI